MIKKALLTISVFLIPAAALAQRVYFDVYNSSPLTEYERLLLVPRAQIGDGLGKSCENNGTIYVNEDDSNLPYFCAKNSEISEWSLFSNIWKQTENIISLKDNLTPSQKKVGIGTGQDSPGFKLTLKNDGGIFAQGTYAPGDSSLANLPSLSPGLYFIWYPKKAALWAGEFNKGAFAQNGPQDSQIGNFSVSFGANNLASGAGSGVLGGQFNKISTGADYSVIVSGQSNTINEASDYNIIAAGQNNQITGNHNFIGSCQNCGINGNFMTVLSGSNNAIGSASSHSFIGSGVNNTIHGNGANVVGTGNENTIYGGYNIISGGSGNAIGTDTAAVSHSHIASGVSNEIYSSYSTIGAVYNSSCQTNEAQTISGGGNHQVEGQYATIGGGDHNIIGTGMRNTISGGSYNAINTGAQNSFISGYNNSIDGTSHNSGITGGLNHSITNSAGASIHGGKNVVVKTGSTYSTITTGEDISLNRGLYSWTIGTNATLSIANSFFWGHYQNAVSVTNPLGNYYFIIATGSVGIGTLDPLQKLHVNGDMKISGNLSISHPPDLVSGLNLRRASNGVVGLDLAERFLSDETVEPGDVVAISDNARVIKSSRPYDTRVIGIVSSFPGALLDGTQIKFSPGGIAFEGGDNPPVALAGRAVVKVTLENGRIEPGDLLTSSSLPGHAMRAENPINAAHTIVAKALEGFEGGAEGQQEGMIQAIVTLR